MILEARGGGQRPRRRSERESDPSRPTPESLLGAVRQIDAGLLNVGYVDAGPADGPAVVLLHGWPYDIHSYAEVIPLLAAAGYRVIVPYLRGLRNDPLPLGRDGPQRRAGGARARRDRPAWTPSGIETAIVAGFDWGARTRRHRRRALAASAAAAWCR